MDCNHPDIKQLRDTVAALRTQLKACAVIHDDVERTQMIRFLQTEIAFAERVIRLKLEDGLIAD